MAIPAAESNVPRFLRPYTVESDDGGASEDPRMEQRSYVPPPMQSPPNPLAEILSRVIQGSLMFTIKISKQLYMNSSVIVLSAGLAGGVHYLASKYSPIASAATDPSFDGSVALAKFVGLASLIQTALKPIHQEFTNHCETEKKKINAHIVRYLTPIALAWIAAYQHGMPLKFAATTLYTMGTFAAIKLLNMGYEVALELYNQQQHQKDSDRM